MVGDNNAWVQLWPENGLENIEICPICGERDRKCIYTELYDRVFFCAPGRWTLYQCNMCGSAYLDPRPTMATIGMAYQKYFTHESGSIPDYYSLSLHGKIRRIMANGYRNWRFGSNYRPSTFLGVIASVLLPKQIRGLDAHMRHLPKNGKGRSLLDFGCGNGEFVSRAKDAGWLPIGMDMDPEAVRVAQNNGLNVYLGGTDKIAILDMEFDVITLSHVIEHVHDPGQLLRTCYRCLKPGGFLWIETPNFNSQGHGIYGRNWRGLEPPRHLVIFTSNSLHRLLKDVGFHRIHHQKENPVLPMVFGASEAIQEGDDPLLSWKKWTQKKGKQWHKYIKIAKKNYQVREFVTLTAYKPMEL